MTEIVDSNRDYKCDDYQKSSDDGNHNRECEEGCVELGISHVPQLYNADPDEIGEVPRHNEPKIVVARRPNSTNKVIIKNPASKMTFGKNKLNEEFTKMSHQAKADRDVIKSMAKDGKKTNVKQEVFSKKVVVNLWSLQTGTGTRNFNYLVNSSGDRVTIDGTFNISTEDSKKLVYLSGEYPIYDGISPYDWVSTCGTVLGVKNNTSSRRKDYIAGFKHSNVMDRLWNSVDAVLAKIDYRRANCDKTIAVQIRCHFRKYYPDYPRLEVDIKNLMVSSKYWHLYREHQKLRSATLEVMLESRLRQECVERGLDYHYEFKKIQGHWNYFLFQVLGVLFLLFGVVHYHYGIVYAGSSCLGFGLLFCRVCVPLSRYEILRKLEDKYLKRSNIGGFLVPCAKIKIQSSEIAVERIPEIGSPDMIIEVDDDIFNDTPGREYDIFGTTIPGDMVIPTQSVRNLLGALAIRMGQHESVFDLEFFNFACDYFDNLLREYPFVYEFGELRPFLVMKYGETKGSRLYTQFMESELTIKDFECLLFVKKEAYLGKNPDNFKPRMIWANSELVVAMYSFFFNQMSQWLSCVYSYDSECFYATKTTPDQLGMYAKKLFDEYQHVYVDDVKSFDGSLGCTVVAFEQYVLEQLSVGCPEKFSLIISQWCTKTGKTRDGSLRVQMEHGRESGSGATTPLNTLLNKIFHLWSYRQKGSNMLLGDDGISGYPTPVDVEDVKARYGRLGIEVDILLIENIDSAEFCSGVFVPNLGGYKWANKPFRALQKLGINYHGHPPKMYKRLLYGTALGLLPSSGHVPIIGSILRAIVDSAQEKRLKPFIDNRHLNPYRPQGGLVSYPDMDTYQWFSRRYCMEVETIMAIEDYIDCTFHIDNCPYELRGDVFITGLETDLGTVDGIQRYVSEQMIGKNFVTASIKAKDELTIDYIINHAPLVEEIEKLRGCKNLYEALIKAHEFGASEDADYGTRTHAVLHMLFTALSWYHLPLGVEAHKEYNKFAVRTGVPQCRRRRRNRVKEKIVFVDSRSGRNANRPPKPRKKPQGIKTAKKKKGLFALLGQAAGHYMAGSAGGVIGEKLGQAVATATGYGAYRINKNTIIQGDVPHFAQNRGGTRVVYREYVADIISSASANTFSVDTFRVNPAVSELFAWLSGLASLYEEYIIHGMLIEFKSMSGSSVGSITTSLGTIIISAKYNPDDPAFTSKREMENHEFAVSGRVDCDIIYGLECDMRTNPLKVLYTDDGTNVRDSYAFYDMARLYVASTGMQGTSVNLGELWITYDIELLKPRLVDGISGDVKMGRIQGRSFTDTGELGTAYTVSSNFELSLGTTTNTYDTLVLGNTVRGERYLIVVYWKGSSTATTSITYTYTGCIQSVDGAGLTDDTVWKVDSSGTTTNKFALIFITVNSDAGAASVKFASATLPSSGTYVETYVFQIPYPWTTDDPPLLLADLLRDPSPESYIDEDDEKYTCPPKMVKRLGRGARSP